jgi:hypothetical protein
MDGSGSGPALYRQNTVEDGDRGFDRAPDLHQLGHASFATTTIYADVTKDVTALSSIVFRNQDNSPFP